MGMGVVGPNPAIEWIAFGPYLLFPGQRLLKRHGKPVHVRDRTFDLLIALVERPGEVFSKAELAERVWRQEWVEDVNLRVTVGILRKLLGRTDAGATTSSTQSVAAIPFRRPFRSKPGRGDLRNATRIDRRRKGLLPADCRRFSSRSLGVGVTSTRSSVFSINRGW
jgi:hypothetical protein